jgi:hypothetical protein
MSQDTSVSGGGYSLYSYVANNPVRWIDPQGLMKLPSDPSGLPPEWTRDPSHRDPNGERYRGPDDEYLDFHKGRPGQPGWRGKDHWHHNGEDEHLEPGDEIPDPEPEPDPEPTPEPTDGQVCKSVAVAVAVPTGAYIIYRVVRFLPSLLPPLWETIPLNLAVP